MGLLDQFFGNADQTAALGLLGSHLMAGNAPGGFQAASGLLADAPRRRMQQEIAQMQMEQQRMALEKARRDEAQEQQILGAAKGAYRSPEMANALSMGPTPDGGAVPQVAPGFDSQQFLSQLYGINPMKAVAFEQSIAKDNSPLTVAPGASLVDRKTLKPVFTAPKEQSTPSAIQEYQFAQQQGFKGSFADWELQKRKAGASNVQVKVDNKMGESLAGQVGPMAKDSRVQATGAVQMFDAADRIEQALNSNKVLAGPGASKIQTVRQFAQLVGGGNDEGIRQTRQVVKSLAQMAVEARKQLQGQGQVTENEALAVAKADAGDINDLTVGELRDLVTLTKRASHFTAKGHNEILRQLAAKPETAGLVPFYQVQRMDDLLKHTPTLPQIGPNPSIDALVEKYAK